MVDRNCKVVDWALHPGTDIKWIQCDAQRVASLLRGQCQIVSFACALLLDMKVAYFFVLDKSSRIMPEESVVLRESESSESLQVVLNRMFYELGSNLKVTAGGNVGDGCPTHAGIALRTASAAPSMPLVMQLIHDMAAGSMHVSIRSQLKSIETLFARFEACCW